MKQRETLAAWLPLIGQMGGLAGCLIFVPLVWLLTGRIEPLLIASFGTLASAGFGVDVVREFRATAHPRPKLEVVRQEDEG